MLPIVCALVIFEADSYIYALASLDYNPPIYASQRS
jgi:hypothetical protein